MGQMKTKGEDKQIKRESREEDIVSNGKKGSEIPQRDLNLGSFVPNGSTLGAKPTLHQYITFAYLVTSYKHINNGENKK